MWLFRRTFELQDIVQYKYFVGDMQGKKYIYKCRRPLNKKASIQKIYNKQAVEKYNELQGCRELLQTYILKF